MFIIHLKKLKKNVFYTNLIEAINIEILRKKVLNKEFRFALDKIKFNGEIELIENVLFFHANLVNTHHKNPLRKFDAELTKMILNQN